MAAPAPISPSVSSASLGRRLAALGYDALLLLAVIFVTAGVLSPLAISLGLPTQEVNGVVVPRRDLLQWLLFPILCLEVWAFYAWFWTHGGQTLGMKTWRIQTRQQDGRPMNLAASTARVLAGVLTLLTLGLGYLLVWCPGRATLHDRLSRTVVVTLPKTVGR